MRLRLPSFFLERLRLQPWFQPYYSKHHGLFEIFELAVPLEPNIQAANLRKTEKYSHMVKDISDMKVNLIPFIRSRLARVNISPLRTKKSSNSPQVLPVLHPLLRVHQKPLNPSVLSSYYIFINRKTADWDTDTPALKPPFWTRHVQVCT